MAYCITKLSVIEVLGPSQGTHFPATLVQADVEVEFSDLPNVEGPVGRFMLRQMLSVAELEAGMIADRTRKTLAAAKARGVKLGGDRGNLSSDSAKGRELSLKVRQDQARRRAGDLAGIISGIKVTGAVSLRAIADRLNKQGVPTLRGGRWSAVQVSRVLKHLYS